MARIKVAASRRVARRKGLSLVLRDIEAGPRKIAKQAEIIAKLDAGGHDAAEALRELATFERAHAINIASHCQIMREPEVANQVALPSLEK